MKRSVILTVFSLLVLAQLGLAQVPQTISYQGVLRDAGTKEIVPNGDYDLTFKIWDAATGGTTLWTEMHLNATTNAVPVADGVFSVILGQITALPDPFPSPAWLEIVDGAGTPLDPRVELTAVPYSLNARVVTGVDNFFPGTGRVGIGTPNPQAELHVARGDWILGSSSALPGLGESAWLTTGAGILYDAGGADWAHHFSAYGSGDIARFGISAGIGQAPDSRVVITNSGNVGIGTTNPGTRLNIEKGGVTYSGDNAQLRISDGNASNKSLFIGYDPDLITAAGRSFLQSKEIGNINTPLLLNPEGGNVGIGTTDPTAKLDVAGNAYVQGTLTTIGDASVEGYLFVTADASVLGNLDASGDVSTQGTLTALGDANIGGTITIPATERWVSILGVGFHGFGSTYYDSSYCIYHKDKYNKRSVYAPLNLPHGATIIQFEATIKDTGADNMTIELVSMDLSAGTVTTIVSKASTGVIGVETLTGVTSPSHVVDNRNNTYVLKAAWQAPPPRWPPTYQDSDVALRGVRVKYTVNQPLP